MNFISEVINSSQLENIINLPFELKNREVEVIVIPYRENSEKKHKSPSMYGILSKYRNPNLIENEKSAWMDAVEEKHN